MRWRVFTLALLVLVLFVGLGRLYVRRFVRQQANGIILVVVNGMDAELLQRARQQAAARGQKLFLDEMSYVGQLTVQGSDSPVPDEAAAATALASGQRVKNGYVGCDQKGDRFNTLIYKAQNAKRRTGLVTTSEVTMPVPVSFYGYLRGGEAAEQRNAAELIDSSKVDVIFGGGARHFRPANVLNEMGRKDGRDLEVDAAKYYGYTVVHTPVELERVVAWRTNKCLGLFTPGLFHFSALRQGAATMPTLSDMTRRAIEMLQLDWGGYFLVVENGLVAQAARANLTSLAVAEVEALDEAVRTAVSYAGKESLVVVTNGYSLGAMSALPAEVGVTGKTRMPEWISGPGGVATLPEDRTWLKERQAVADRYPAGKEFLTAAPSLIFTRQARVTSSPGWVAAHGFAAGELSGIYPNTDLYLRLDKLISK